MIVNVNFFLRRRRTCRGQCLRPLNRLPNFYYASTLMLSPTPTKPSYQSAAKFAIVKVYSPIQPGVLDIGPNRCYKKLIRRQGRIGNYV